MHFLTLILAAPLLFQGVFAQTFETDILAAKALFNLATYTAQHGYPSGSCTLQNVAIRREWGALSARERKDYINAVKCLASKPNKTPASQFPGARNRYDDFVATHMNQTLSIHGTGNFIGWHRYFTWAYEQALRNECGYKGYQPYWNWAKSAMDPLNSPMFDGSNTSMSGNGEYFFGNQSWVGIPTNDAPDIKIPKGTGGGCVRTGPFKDWQVNLGPVAPVLTYVEKNPDPSGLGTYYNPRCMRRDISQWTSSRWSKDSDISSLINANTDIYPFWSLLQGVSSGYMGVHAAGHFTIGGDPGGDFYTSPGDPTFFLHHAQVDRTWWMWQNQDPVHRTYAVAGTITFSNTPPSRNATLDDLIDLGVNGDAIKLRDTMSTLAGPFCYVYV
ncbi:Di-copper centre-containing protein [Cenococcum geophilum 1.58]|uniref:Di-copper centre-containing protein n=1 Tax=Cenococcum geophilum 1.58 TaxID=794803 RepID=UPI00358EFB67|nr:Di-copper centre-containing protein [Cenococcum geophilum 1.58]